MSLYLLDTTLDTVSNYIAMINSEVISKDYYYPPTVRIIPLSMENAVCGSPIPGGNEDIGYDDEW